MISEEKMVITLAHRNIEAMELVLGPLSIREDDMFAEKLEADHIRRMLGETGNEKALESENYSASLEVYGSEEGDEFYYKLVVQEHTGPDWGKKTMGETDTSYSASTKEFRGPVPEDTEVYEEASQAEKNPFR